MCIIKYFSQASSRLVIENAPDDVGYIYIEHVECIV
jgi:hypothetical protein